MISNGHQSVKTCVRKFYALEVDAGLEPEPDNLDSH